MFLLIDSKASTLGCQYYFNSHDDLIDHCKSEDHDNLKCQLCKVEYKNEDLFLQHVTLKLCQKNRKKQKSVELIRRTNTKGKRQILTKKPKRTKENPDELSCNKCEDFPTTNHFKEMFEHYQKEHKRENSCLMCEVSFKNRESILNHMEVHSKKTFCRTHFLAFDTTEELQKHFKIPNHNKVCLECDMVLKSSKAYITHRLKKHLGKDKVKCPHCPLYYENRQNVRRHILRFHEKLKFMCEQCGNTYTTRTNLKLHVARQHEGQEPEQFEPVCCEECGKMFRNKKTLFHHRFKQHWGHSCICRHCKQTFPDKAKLEEHIKESGHELFECELCHKTYVTKVKYMQHMESHTENEGNKTKYNNVKFRRRWWKYRNEEKIPTVMQHDPNQRHFCTICKREFKNLHTMMQHRKIHFSDKPFKCEICAKSFRVKRFLTCHMNIHTGNRPFKCQYCDKGFLNDSSKYQHEMIHTGKRPHKCPECDKGFISSSAMKKHIQIHMKDSKSVAYLSEYLKSMRPKIARFSSEEEALAAAATSATDEHHNPEEVMKTESKETVEDKDSPEGFFNDVCKGCKPAY